jgi:hypothetical protein
MPVVDSFTNSRINMLPDKLSGKKPVVPDNYLFVPDNVRDRPLIFRLVPEVPQNNVLIFHRCKVALVTQNRSNSQCQIAFVMLFFSHFLCCKDIAGEY